MFFLAFPWTSEILAWFANVFRFCFFTDAWKLTVLSISLSWTNCLWAFLPISSDIRMSLSTSEGTEVPDEGQYSVSLSSIVKGLQSILPSLGDRSWKTCCTFLWTLARWSTRQFSLVARWNCRIRPTFSMYLNQNWAVLPSALPNSFFEFIITV